MNVEEWFTKFTCLIFCDSAHLMNGIHGILDGFVEFLSPRLSKAAICISLHAVNKLTPSS